MEVPELVFGGCRSPGQVSNQLGQHAVKDGLNAALVAILRTQLMALQVLDMLPMNYLAAQ